MHTVTTIRQTGNESIERKMQSYSRKQRQDKNSRKLKQSLVELSGVSTSAINTLQYQVYDAA